MTRIIDEVIPIRSSGKSGGGGVIDDSRSFRIRTHGDIGRVKLHEYRCPTHGLFVVEAADATDLAPCPAPNYCEECNGNGYPQIDSPLFRVNGECVCACGGDGLSRETRHGEPSPWAGASCAIGVPSGEVTG